MRDDNLFVAVVMGSNLVTARNTIPPFPVVYKSFAPAVPIIEAPVGKSGAGTISKSCSVLTISLDIRPLANVTHAVMSSRKLCGGMLVAIPTAIPAAPFNSNTGTRAGSTTGSKLDPSKVAI